MLSHFICGDLIKIVRNGDLEMMDKIEETRLHAGGTQLLIVTLFCLVVWI